MSAHDRKLSCFSFVCNCSFERQVVWCAVFSFIGPIDVVDAQIQALQKSRQATVNADRVAADKWSLDSEIYGSAPSAAGNRYDGYVQSIPAGDEDDEPEEVLPTRRAGGIPGVALEDAKAGDDVSAFRGRFIALISLWKTSLSYSPIPLITIV